MASDSAPDYFTPPCGDSPVPAGKGTLQYCLLTHWDREWYQSQATYELRLLQVLHQVLEGLQQKTLPHFCLDGQTSLVEDACALQPELRAPLEKGCVSGQLHVGPWYTMPDTLLVGLESLIRNLRLGLAQARLLGCKEFMGYLPDTFGHADYLPTLFRGFGLRHAMIWRGRRLSDSAKPFFWWQGPDGSTVLAYQLPEGYFQNQWQDPALSLEDRQLDFARLKQRLGATAPLAWVPLGGDHLGPPLASLSGALKHATLDGCWAFPHQFLRSAEQSLPLEEAPLERGALLAYGEGAPFLLSGSWSARLALKVANYRLEFQLSRWLEPLLALTQARLGKVFPAQEAIVAQQWKRLIQNHAHDSICGCSIDAVHQENALRFAQIEQQSLALRQWALWQWLAAYQQVAHQKNEEQPLVLAFNMASRQASGCVPVTLNLPEGEAPPSSAGLQWLGQTPTLLNRYELLTQDVPLSDRLQNEHTGLMWFSEQHALPSVGLRAFTKTALLALQGPGPDRQVRVNGEAGAFVLENEWLRVRLVTGQGMFAECRQSGNVFGPLHLPYLRRDVGDSYNKVPDAEAGDSAFRFKSVAVLENGPLQARCRLTYVCAADPAFTLESLVTLRAGEPLLRFTTSWLQKEPDQLLQVAFSGDALVTVTLPDSALGVRQQSHPHTAAAERFKGYPVRENHEEWLPEGCCARHAVSWQGQTLLTRGLPDYEVVETTVRLTLHRGFASLSGGRLPSRGTPAGPPLATPEGQGLGHHVREYAWTPGSQVDGAPCDPLALALHAEGLQLAWGSYVTLDAAQNDASGQAPKPLESLGLPALPEGLEYNAIRALAPNWQARSMTRSALEGEQGLCIRLLNRLDTPFRLLVSTFSPSAPVWTLNLEDIPLAQHHPDQPLTLPAHGLLSFWMPLSGGAETI